MMQKEEVGGKKKRSVFSDKDRSQICFAVVWLISRSVTEA